MSGAATDDGIDWRFDTPRLHGRLVDERDRDFYRALYTDPAMMAHIGPELDAAGADALLQRVIRCNEQVPMRGRYWALLHARTGESVGMLSLLRMERSPSSANIGLMVLPAWQNKGAGLPALGICVDYAMSGHWRESFDSITCQHAHSNPVAGRLVSALGFRAIPSTDPGMQMWELKHEWWAVRRSGRAGSRQGDR